MAKWEGRTISGERLGEGYIKFVVRIDVTPSWLGRIFGRKHRSTEIYCQYNEKTQVIHNVTWKYTKNNVELKPVWHRNMYGENTDLNRDAKLIYLARTAVDDYTHNRDPYRNPWDYDTDLPSARLLSK